MRGESADLGRAGAGRKGRIDRVDVERDLDLAGANMLVDLLERGSHADRQRLV